MRERARERERKRERTKDRTRTRGRRRSRLKLSTKWKRSSGAADANRSVFDTRCADEVTEISRVENCRPGSKKSHDVSHTADARVPFAPLTINEEGLARFAPHHAHTHAHRHNGATNYSGQNGTSSIIRECDFSLRFSTEGERLRILRPTEEFRVCTDCPSRSHRPGWAILNFNLNLSV